MDKQKFTIIFKLTEPEDLENVLQISTDFLQSVLACLVVQGVHIFTKLDDDPKIFNESVEASPRIEYNLGIARSRTNKIQWLGYLLHTLKSQANRLPPQCAALLHYSVELPQSEKFFEMSYSNFDSFILKCFSLGNVIDNSTYNIHRLVEPDIEQLMECVIDLYGNRNSPNNQQNGRYNQQNARYSLPQSPSFNANRANSPPYQYRRQTSEMRLVEILGEERKENIIRYARQAMRVEFEHDRRSLTIDFLSFRCLKNSETRKVKKVIDAVKLSVQYASISQVYWEVHEVRKERKQTEFVLRLLLRIKHPPAIRRFSDSFNLRQMAGAEGRRQQYRRGPHEGGSGERCKNWLDSDAKITDDVKDAPILALKFESIPELDLSKLLGRLQGCLKVPFEMRNFVDAIVPDRCRRMPDSRNSRPLSVRRTPVTSSSAQSISQLFCFFMRSFWGIGSLQDPP